MPDKQYPDGRLRSPLPGPFVRDGDGRSFLSGRRPSKDRPKVFRGTSPALPGSGPPDRCPCTGASRQGRSDLFGPVGHAVSTLSCGVRGNRSSCRRSHGSWDGKQVRKTRPGSTGSWKNPSPIGSAPNSWPLPKACRRRTDGDSCRKSYSGIRMVLN